MTGATEGAERAIVTRRGVVAELERLLLGHVSLHRERRGDLPRQDHDPKWPSPCQVGPPDAAGRIAWEPVRRRSPPDFTGLERALEAELHPDAKAFYGTFWSDSVPVRAEEGGAVLIQVWNEADFERLVENLIGHAIAKSRARAPLTVFFGCTDEEELNLALDNASGAVVLEAPGARPERELAGSLGEFLARLVPAYEPVR